MSAEDPTIVDCEYACEGCPAASKDLMVSDTTRDCPFYEKREYTVDGSAVGVTSHERHNVQMLGQYAGAGILKTRQTDPLTGKEITIGE